MGFGILLELPRSRGVFASLTAQPIHRGGYSDKEPRKLVSNDAASIRTSCLQRLTLRLWNGRLSQRRISAAARRPCLKKDGETGRTLQSRCTHGARMGLFQSNAVTEATGRGSGPCSCQRSSVSASSLNGTQTAGFSGRPPWVKLKSWFKKDPSGSETSFEVASSSDTGPDGFARDVGMPELGAGESGGAGDASGGQGGSGGGGGGDRGDYGDFSGEGAGSEGPELKDLGQILSEDDVEKGVSAEEEELSKSLWRPVRQLLLASVNSHSPGPTDGGRTNPANKDSDNKDGSKEDLGAGSPAIVSSTKEGQVVPEQAGSGDSSSELNSGEDDTLQNKKAGGQSVFDWLAGIVHSVLAEHVGGQGNSATNSALEPAVAERGALIADTAKQVLELLSEQQEGDSAMLAQKTEVFALKRLQREAFNELLRAKERLDKVEHHTGLRKIKALGEPMAAGSKTRMRGEVDIGAGYVPAEFSGMEFARMLLAQIGLRSGANARFSFETPFRERDLLVTQASTGAGNVGLGGPLNLDKILYSANLSDDLSLKVAPMGATVTDMLEQTLNPLQGVGLTRLSSGGGPSLSHACRGSAAAVTLRGGSSHVVVTAAQFLSGCWGADAAASAAGANTNGGGGAPGTGGSLLLANRSGLLPALPCDAASSSLCSPAAAAAGPPPVSPSCCVEPMSLSTFANIMLHPHAKLVLSFSALNRFWPTNAPPLSPGGLHWSEIGPLLIGKAWPLSSSSGSGGGRSGGEKVGRQQQQHRSGAVAGEALAQSAVGMGGMGDMDISSPALSSSVLRGGGGGGAWSKAASSTQDMIQFAGGANDDNDNDEEDEESSSFTSSSIRGTAAQSLAISIAADVVPGEVTLAGWAQAERADWLQDSERRKLQWAVMLSRPSSSARRVTWGLCVGSTQQDLWNNNSSNNNNSSTSASSSSNAAGATGAGATTTTTTAAANETHTTATMGMDSNPQSWREDGGGQVAEQFQMEAFLRINLGKGFTLQPGIVHVVDKERALLNSQNAGVTTVMLRSLWNI